MEERIHTIYYNSSVYHISIHSKLLFFEIFFLCHYLVEITCLTHFCISIIVECVVLTARTSIWVVCFVNPECIINIHITVSCKYLQIVWDKGNAVYVNYLFCSQTVFCKYPIIIILSSGKVTLVCHENSCYYCAFLFLACAKEEPLILDETYEELVIIVLWVLMSFILMIVIILVKRDLLQFFLGL